MSAIKKIIGVIVERLNTVVNLETYTEMYPASMTNYLIWVIKTQSEPFTFGVIIRDGKVELSDVLVDVNSVKNKFLAGQEVDGIEGVVELTQDAVMNLVLKKIDVFGCEVFHQNLNLYTNSVNHLRTLLTLMFSQEYTKLVEDMDDAEIT